jgi:hypothetical protein
VKGNRLRISRIGTLLDEFIEDQQMTYDREFSDVELNEIERLRRQPRDFVGSFMYEELDPYALVYFER